MLFVWLFVINILLFALMRFDKQQSRKRKQRIPEKLLLSLGFFGGPVGGLLGMNLFRHKTKHRYFYLVYAASLGMWAWITYRLI
ncbi:MULTISPECIES: DUF1294 domain-containing protein [unclassified Jeotgalibaca]|uniref:DUF1294 domain-containing protein n=1 Tax=unclassified Jeotgalibaca TaxID=2621505 RepID=UPI003FD0312D